ncbi:MAG: hypothetical protein SPK35_08360, partial [Prevotella sp.]|nr:hypothetical protein [Prevotella sp.]
EQSHFGYNKLDTLLNKSPSFCPSQTQSIASANAKLCNRQRKALQSPTQSFAIVHAKLCIDPPSNSLGKGVFILKSLSQVFQTLGSAWCALLSLSAGDQCCR